MLSAKNAEQFKRSIKLEMNEDFKMQSEFDKKNETIYNSTGKMKIITAGDSFVTLYPSVPSICRD